MNPYLAYRRQEESTGWTRMDLLLALYDKALERLDRAAAALKAGDAQTAVPQMSKTQLIVAEMAAGVRLEGNEENGANMLRLYEYVSNELRQPKSEGIANARKILATLREGFEAVRAEANELERTGRLPSAEQLRMVHATA
jgi:flagellar secretion chaperone FliS